MLARVEQARTPRPTTCTRCTMPIAARVRHWTIGGYRVCDRCIDPDETAGA